MALFEGEIGAVCHGAALEAPVFFLVYGPDDDILRHGSSYLTLADLLQPCHVAALGYDEAADACSTLGELAEEYAQRALLHLDGIAADGGGGRGAGIRPRAVLVGYGLSAVVAHRTALALAAVGGEVALVVLDSDVDWPPEPSLDRIGGYPWLGGDVEAALLACRALGLGQLARREVEALQDFPNNLLADSEREDLLMRLYWELAASSELPQPYYERYIRDTAVLLEGLRGFAACAGPPTSFQGPVLLLVARDSPEFRAARRSAERCCASLEVATLPGTHYRLCQSDALGVPIELPQVISEFLLRRGFFGPEPLQAVLTVAPAVAATAAAKRLACAGRLDFLD